MYRIVHVMKDGQKDPVIRSPSYSEGEQISIITDEMAAKNPDLGPSGLFFEICGKNPSTGLANPIYHLPKDGDALYVMEIIGGEKVTIASHRWPLPDGQGDTPT